MKRVDSARRLWLRRRQIKHQRREQYRKLKRTARRLGRQIRLDRRRSYARKNGLFFDTDLARHQIELPETFSLRDNYEPTVAVITELRDFALRQNRSVMLQFGRVQTIEVAAALVLVAEIFRARNLRSVDAVTGTYPRSQIIYDLLLDIGFYGLLNVQEWHGSVPTPTQAPGRPAFLRFVTGNRVDSVLVDSFVSVVEKHCITLNAVARGRLVGAIIEAMSNTDDHAFPVVVANETMPDRWWMSSRVNVAEREITILLFDQGVGIPKTLDATTYERIRAAMKNLVSLRSASANPSDGEMILAATELHRTSTGQHGRGKGFRNMKQFVDVCPDGELRVLSNRGRYSYVRGTESYGDESSSVGGTVIEWRFRHEGTVEFKDE